MRLKEKKEISYNGLFFNIKFFYFIGVVNFWNNDRGCMLVNWSCV